MNLRQKCKKLKQENERLKHMKVPVARYLPPYIETLGVRKMVTENELHVPPSYIEKKMAYDMAEALLPYIEFERYPDHNGLVIQGKIRIVTRV